MKRLEGFATRAYARLRGLDFRYVPPEKLNADLSRVRAYADSRIWLRAALSRFANESLLNSADQALDLGCGKGGAVSVLSRYFARADGIDISPDLITIGRENLRRMGIANASLTACDAAEFRNFDGYGFLYIFNPFSRAVMARATSNLAASLHSHPRRMTILYLNPLDIDLFEAQGFRRLREIYPKRTEYPFVLLAC